MLIAQSNGFIVFCIIQLILIDKINILLRITVILLFEIFMKLNMFKTLISIVLKTLTNIK